MSRFFRIVTFSGSFSNLDFISEIRKSKVLSHLKIIMQLGVS
jgi:hypothetical protein